MLTLLRIARFAVIDELEVRFEPGMNVLTGETGAGKSILVNALHLLLGGRATADVVRTGHDECTVEALFEPSDPAAFDAGLDAAGLPPCADGQLVVRRAVHREGRSRAWVNGSPATASQLAQATSRLVDISSQHEHTSLLDESGHLDLLDAFAGLGTRREAYRTAWDALSAAGRLLTSLQTSEAERARRLDYVRFQLDELERADPRPGEDSALAEERTRLASAEKLREAASGAESLLYSRDGAAVELLDRAAGDLEKAAGADPALKPLADSLRESVVRVSDAARELGRYARALHADPARLEALDDRLDVLRRLARKHGGDLASVLRRRDEMRLEVSQLVSHEEHLAAAQADHARRLDEAGRLADALSSARTAAAGRFAAAVVEQLGALDMKRTVLEVRVEPLAASEGSVEAGGVRLDARGRDGVRFLFSPNPGEEPRPLARIASGGELSRAMLALKRVLARRDPVETWIFDEVDAGIGGATGEVVGRMLRDAAHDRQVLCITHLAQIAACAGTHFVVRKETRAGRTRTGLERLEGADERRRELARMLSGHVTDASLRHAGELVERGTPPRRASRRG